MDESGIEANSPKGRALSFLRLVVENRIKEAYERHVAEGAVSHNPFFGGGRQDLMDAMEENARAYPRKILSVKRAVAEGDLVAVHSHVRMDEGSLGFAAVHIMKFDERGKISEIWDVAQEVPKQSPNKNGMF